jgi:hypothetical protein
VDKSINNKDLQISSIFIVFFAICFFWFNDFLKIIN